MKCVNIAVTGYYGTGSSAVIDLLREYEDVRVVPDIGRPYEHEIFYYPGGLFDLCSLLLSGNTPQGSDIYINNFIKTIHRLNDSNYVWYGSYQKLCGDKLMQIAQEFVDSIAEKREGTNSYHNLGTRFSIIKSILQFAAHIVYGRRVAQYGVKYIKDGNPIYFSMPTEEEFYAAAKKFTSSYFELFNKDQTASVYDHLIWPQQVNTYKRCFSDNLKIIVVNRDPRDVFLSSKYFWCKPKAGSSVGKPHFGVDPISFAEEWKRTVVLYNDNPNAIQINFEDLVYDYVNTKDKIKWFLGLDENKHVFPLKYFDPAKSIENTQVFSCNDIWAKEAMVIAEAIPEYIYRFPYKRETDINKMFDGQKKIK